MEWEMCRQDWCFKIGGETGGEGERETGMMREDKRHTNRKQ